MPSQTYRAADIKGLTPAIDPTRSDELFVLAARNVWIDSIGPRSLQGTRFLLPHRLVVATGVQGAILNLPQGALNFVFTDQAIQVWDEEQGGWTFIFVHFTRLTTNHRWTHAYINGKVAFCHPDVGILVYDVATGICDRIENLTTGTPERAIAVCENNGRLCAIGPDYWQCSYPSDMLNWALALGGGVLQKINDRVSGYPLMITSFAAGTFTWTTGGVMKSEFTGDSAVYRHRAMATEYRPANSYCVARMNDESVVFLDKRGLFQTAGGTPTPYSPVFNEFLSAFIQDNNLDVIQALRLEWDASGKRIYLSVQTPYGGSLYTKAFIHYPAIDKWGSFDSPHYGILPLLIEDSTRADLYFGFVDESGQFNYWLDANDREILPTDPLLNLRYPLIQKPTSADYDLTGRVICSSGLLEPVSRVRDAPPPVPAPEGFGFILDIAGEYITEDGVYIYEAL